MVDDLKNRGPADRSRVNIHEDYEVRYWTEKWGVSEAQLVAAVKKVGVSASAAEDLLRELTKLEGALGDRFPSRDLIATAEVTRDRAAALNTRAATADGDEAVRIDRALMQVSRALVPIDYTSGDRFGHDLAMGVPAWASLVPLRALAAEPAGSDTDKFRRVDATRARNRVLDALQRTNEVLAQVL
jgi:aminopeptidase YwaD